MINFTVPDYPQFFKQVLYFKALEKEAPYVLFQNRRIDSVYGMPSQLIWNGGRAIDTMNSLGFIVDAVKMLREQGLKINHVCTNCKLQEHDYYNQGCNNWLKIHENDGDGVIVFDEKLAAYIREHFPKYKIIWSTTKGRIEPPQLNELTAAGDDVVLYYSYNHDEERLRQLINLPQVEILCGEECLPFCQTRAWHYKVISEMQLGLDTQSSNVQRSCRQKCYNNFYNQLKNDNVVAITNEYLDYLYETYGFNNFKIAGRDQPPFVYGEIMLYYLIKPEYRDPIRLDMWYKFDNKVYVK